MTINRILFSLQLYTLETCYGISPWNFDLSFTRWLLTTKLFLEPTTSEHTFRTASVWSVRHLTKLSLKCKPWLLWKVLFEETVGGGGCLAVVGREGVAAVSQRCDKSPVIDDVTSKYVPERQYIHLICSSCTLRKTWIRGLPEIC